MKRFLTLVAAAASLAGCATPGLLAEPQPLPEGQILGRCTAYEVDVDGYMTDSGGNGEGCQCYGNNLELILALRASECEEN